MEILGMMLKDDEQIVVRPMQKEDLLICEKIESFAADPWNYEDLKSALNGGISHCFVATINDEVAAFCSVQNAAGELSLNSITVSPCFRRQGIAKKMLCYVFNLYSPCDIFLEVRHSNAFAINLYLSLGFKKVGLRKKFYSSPVEDAILMSRKIGD